MKIIARIDDNVIVSISNICEKVDNGYRLDEYVLAEIDGRKDYIVYDVQNIPTGIAAQTHKYDGAAFTVNENYIEPVNIEADIRSLIVSNAELKQENANINYALMMGGLI